MPRRPKTPRWVRRRLRGPCEWIGGVLTVPLPSGAGERAEVVVWAEVPMRDLIVHDVAELGDGASALGELLGEALATPAAGRRPPDRLRVATEALASAVRAAVGDAVPVVVAPIPELDDLENMLIDELAGQVSAEDTYLGDGSLQPDDVASLFAAARSLHLAAPWRLADEHQVLRLDIPDLGVEGACLSILGRAEVCRGVLVFPTLEDYEIFQDSAERAIEDAGDEALAPDWRPDLGDGVLALVFDPDDQVCAARRRELEEQGWLLAGPDAYPRVEQRASDGGCLPLEARDLRIAEAFALALASFTARHAQVFEADDPEPVCESYYDNEDLEVRLTFPYEAYADFDITSSPEDWFSGGRAGGTPALRRQPQAGRNDPCPCGSGRKYKKCCLARDEAAAQGGSGEES